MWWLGLICVESESKTTKAHTPTLVVNVSVHPSVTNKIGNEKTWRNIAGHVSHNNVCINRFVLTVIMSLFREVNVSVPESTRKNGTLYLHAFLYPKGKNHMSSSLLAHSHVLITTYALPQAVFINLLGDEGGNKVQHFIGKLVDSPSFDLVLPLTASLLRSVHLLFSQSIFVFHAISLPLSLSPCLSLSPSLFVSLSGALSCLCGFFSFLSSWEPNFMKCRMLHYVHATCRHAHPCI